MNPRLPTAGSELERQGQAAPAETHRMLFLKQEQRQKSTRRPQRGAG